MDPTCRRGLVIGMTAAESEADAPLPDHWDRLLAILGTHDAAHGPHQVFSLARREPRLITEQRRVARGDRRAALMRVEARWAIYAGWLCEDTGDQRGRTALLAHLGDATATERMLREARRLAAEDSALPPMATSAPLAEHVLPCWEARCWAALKPATGVALYDRVLRDWPPRQTRDRGLYLARLATACADAGELDRARAEGRKALAIAHATQSSVTTRELKHLTTTLSTQ